MARDLNLEAWLWYFFTSPEFYEMAAKECEDMRDTFGGVAMAHGKTSYKRNGQIYDAFNTAAQNFRRGIDFVKHEEYNVIYNAAQAVASDIRGMVQWSSPDAWMNEAESKEFHRRTGRIGSYEYLIQHALFNGLKGGNAYMSESNPYKDRDDGFRDSSIVKWFNYYNDEDNFGWKLPSPIPGYEIDKTVSVKTTEVCSRTGVWYPDTGLERHSLVFAIHGLPMPAAFYCDKTMEELLAETGKAYSSKINTTAVETIWHPVKLVEEAPKNVTAFPEKLRCEASEPCPKTGYWWTPAKENSRAHFKQGEIMPDFPGSNYGVTIWQLDVGAN